MKASCPVLPTESSAGLNDWQALAIAHFEAGRHEKAREVCRQILQNDPGDGEALRLLGQCPFDLTDFAVGPTPGLPSPRGQAQKDSEQVLAELYRRHGFRGLQRLGWHVQRNDYYSPLNDCDFLDQNADLWRNNPDPAEIDWRVAAQLETVREISRYTSELWDIPATPPLDGSHFGWNNNFWNNADAIAQYGLVRSRKPRRYVEVGCGWSSLLLQQALERNQREGATTGVTLVEPYPNPSIFKHLPADWRIHHVMLQRATLDVFDQLEAGDVLFYDGSHCARAASDVTWFFFRILPRLQPGVIVHLHDIHLPEDYSNDVLFERGQTWNEQYVLQAFLMHNTAYRVLLANRYLFHRQPEALQHLCQGLQPAVGCSFWMEKTGLDHPPRDTGTRPFPAQRRAEFGELSGDPFASSFPPASEKLQSLERLAGDYTARAQACRAFGPEHLLQLLTVGNYQNPVAIHPDPAPAPPAPDGFPVPPVALTMGYGAGDLNHYLACGRRSQEVLSSLLEAQHVRLEAGDAMLDWGCAAGRALRNFSAEAWRGCQVWGCDVHAPAIAWAQQHLSPPFKFFNSSSLPHLPFAAGTFRFIYGLSVMTHLVTMRDLWLLELRRVLRPDGVVILTVHDENTWTWFRERGWPPWMPQELRDHATLPGEGVDIRGSSWEQCYTFFQTDYIRRVWGQFFTVAAIVPRADCYQSAVILRRT